MDIQTFDDFLSTDECLAFQTMIRNKKAVNFTDSGKFTNKKWVDDSLTNQFYLRLLEIDPRSRYLRANNLVMAGIYSPQDSFGLHTDTGLYYNVGRKEKSRWTLLIYLNTVANGGETVFYSTDKWEVVQRVKPEAGKALLFDIDLWHCAEPILDGEKLWIGCEIIGDMH